MSCPKNFIKLSEDKDYPLLRQVSRSGYVTHRQLFELMELAGHGSSRETFNWRMQRLVAHAWIRRSAAAGLGRNYIYWMDHLGAECLASRGEFGAPFQHASRRELDPGALRHSLDVNEIHLAFARSGVLVNWTWETEIRSQNELTAFGFRKDYDAVMTVRGATGLVEVALEYERTAKGSRHYARIREAIEEESRVDRFLYLVPNLHLHSLLRQVFSGTSRAVFVGDCWELLGRSLETPVTDLRTGRSTPLADAIL